MPKAARLGDMHTCPIPKHVGGPVTSPCSPTIIIENRQAARVGDKATCKAPPDTIATGSSSVFMDGKMAARLGDTTAHGGKIVEGASTVIIGD